MIAFNLPSLEKDDIIKNVHFYQVLKNESMYLYYLFMI